MRNATNHFVERLVAENRGELGAFFKRRLPSRDEVEDAVQEVFLRLCTVRNPGDIHNPRAFLFRTAANVVVDCLRKKRVHDRCFADGVSSPDVASFAPSPERTIDSERWVQAYAEALNELSPKCRYVFVMCRMHGKKHARIAEDLEISTKMVEKYMTQALLHLNKRLDSFLSADLD